MSKPRIYLDHAATTPILPAAKAAMAETLERWANPSSPHAEGRAARAALEDARERIKRALGWDGEVIFTSGATEAIEIALKRAKGGRRFISTVEHDAIFRAAPDATLLHILEHFEVSADSTEARLRGCERPVVAVQDVNSETGKAQPLSALAKAVREAGGILVADCAQSAGKRALPDADMVVVSAHKLGGPPGIGALLVRDFGQLEATGGQEAGYRGGTENVPAALAFAAAAEESRRITEAYRAGVSLTLVELESTISEVGGRVVGRALDWSPYIMAASMPHLSARAQLIQFDMRGIAVSAGSACSSGSLKPSRTLEAFGITKQEAERTIRISVGWTTTAEDILAFREAWLDIAEQARKRAA